MRVKIDELDKLLSQYVRLKANGICSKCLQYKGYKGLQVAHFIGRRYRSTRYDEANVCPLCFFCHQHFHENPLEFVEWFRARLGERDFSLLQARARQIGKPDKSAIELYFKEKISSLQKEI